MDEIIINKIEWSTLEHEHKEHSIDWFWTIGLITLISCGASLWFGNYLFSIFIFISGISLILVSVRHPQEMNFIMETKGLTMGRNYFEWKEIKGFNIIKNEENDKLLIQTSKYFLPVYTISIPKNLTEEIKESLLKIVPSSNEIKEYPSMQFMEKLGF